MLYPYAFKLQRLIPNGALILGNSLNYKVNLNSHLKASVGIYRFFAKSKQSGIKLGARELRQLKSTIEDRNNLKKNPIYLILDNVLDTYNIGAIFRLADAISAEKVFLCGQTETPPNTRIKKASINTTEWVTWEYCKSAVEAIKEVRSLWRCHPELVSGSRDSDLRQNDKGMVVAIEQSEKSIPYDRADYKFPIAFVVGNETTGVSKEVLDIADQIVEIPMWGVNKSLNVMVSLGIVLFKVMEKNTEKIKLKIDKEQK